MNNYYMERLSDIRRHKKICQKQIADFLGIKQSQYSRYESGKNKMPYDYYIKCAVYLQIPLDILCGNSDYIF